MLQRPGPSAGESGTLEYAAPAVSRSFSVTSCINPANGGIIAGDQESCGSFDPVLITSVAAPGGESGTLEYKWQQSVSGSTTGFEDMAAGNSGVCDPGMITQTTWYKRVARVACANGWTDAAESNVVRMTVSPTAVPGTITGTATAITYGSTTGTMTLNGYTGSVIKWQRAFGAAPWTDIATSAPILSDTPSAAGTWRYRAQVKSGSCPAVYSAPLSVTVSPKTLTITGTFTVYDKVFDGNTAATIALNSLALSPAVGGDVVILDAAAAFADNTTGSNKVVSLTGSAISGPDAANYTLSLVNAPTTTAGITPIPLTLGAFPDIQKTYTDPAFVLVSPASPSPAPFSYTCSNTGVATISGNTVTITGAGTATITAAQPPAGGYAGASVTAMLTVAKANQVLTLNPLLPPPLPLNQFIGTPLPVSASSSSGLEVTISLGPGSPATISVTNGKYELTTNYSTGVVVISLDQAGNVNYNPAHLSLSFDVNKGNQSITFGALTPVTYSPGAGILLSATSNSGLPVAFTVISGPASISQGNHLTITGAGTVVIEASQAGDASWNPATSVVQNLTVSKAAATITSFPDIIKTYGEAPFTLGATSDSPGAFSYTSSNTAVATISGNTAVITGAGTSEITVVQDAGANYLAATARATLTVLKADQVITFNAPADKNLADPPFDLAATTTSPLEITFTGSDPSVAAISGKTVTLKGTGQVTITANQPGNANYNAAPAVSRSFTVTSDENPITAFTVTGGGTYCQDNIGLPVSLSGSEPDVIYTLYKDGIARMPTIAGTGTAISFGNQLSGSYTVTGTRESISNTMTGVAVIEKSPPLIAQVTITPNAGRVCPGSNVTFTANPVNGGIPTYQWFQNAIPVGTNLDTYTCTPANGDQIFVIMTSNLDCVSNKQTVSDITTMVVETLPAPVITLNLDTLMSSSDIGNQWYIDGVAIPGATSKKHIAEQFGRYYTIVSQNGCSSPTSNWLSAPSVDENSFDAKFNVYPNPGDGLFNLGIETTRKEVFEITVYNLLGVTILQKSGIYVNGKYKTEVDITGFPEGIYLIALKNKSNKIVKKVILRRKKS